MSNAIYPGSFDPVTVGHLSVIERSARLFDTVTVCVMKKKRSGEATFPQELRVSMLESAVSHLPNVTVSAEDEAYHLLLRKHGAKIIIRCIRYNGDFESETQFANALRKIDPGAETVYLAPDTKDMFISPLAIRELISHGADLTGFAPQSVTDALCHSK